MNYDHHKKAGNQGDVVKHVALVAALDTILQGFERTAFQYADTFAGYAYSPLIQGNEWDEGIEKVFGKGEQLKQNPHTKLWYEWYLQGRPELLGGFYPGSSLIANDVCRLHKKQPSLALWDTSPAVVANLMESYQSQGHRLFTRPARPRERSVREADFLFIDPPGASMVRRRDYPYWARLAEFFENREKPTMVWLPIILRLKKGKAGQPDEIIEDTKPQRDDALKQGLNATIVRWDKGIRTVGCQLFYRLPTKAQNALRAAVEQVVQIMEWEDSLPEEVRVVSHLHTAVGRDLGGNPQ